MKVEPIKLKMKMRIIHEQKKTDAHCFEWHWHDGLQSENDDDDDRRRSKHIKEEVEPKKARSRNHAALKSAERMKKVVVCLSGSKIERSRITVVVLYRRRRALFIEVQMSQLNPILLKTKRFSYGDGT
ncbi:unnamed protein product [Vicia faba]|uniref:Uncharacterized protein n=1 Tax=Vicia faba TaxID=3906 RepID=A0AAV0ZGP3_VICFA|nr:unnamed protein product [Vicia faba]